MYCKLGLLCVMVLHLAESRKIACPCSSDIGSTGCSHWGWVKQKREVFVLTEGHSDFREWLWANVTLVLSHNYYDTSLMCYAHSKRKGYGLMVEMPAFTNTSSVEFTTWAQDVKRNVTDYFADALAVDIVDLVGRCDVDASHIDEVSTGVEKLRNQIPRPTKLVCVMPWKPPCYEKNCHLTHRLAMFCDYIVTNPNSFHNIHDMHCKARATVPKTMLVLGLDEYLSMGVKTTQLMMGIPWHGYDYTCNAPFNATTPDYCPLAVKENVTGACQCYFTESRQKIDMGTIMTKYPRQFEKHSWDGLSSAPYINYQTGNSTHQIWFEGYDSLLDKYMIAKELGLEGVVVWTADDLSNDHNIKDREGIWYWMIHTLFVTSEPKEEHINYAGKAAGIGVGCFLGGCFLGFILTCIASQRRIDNIRKRRRPFEKDLQDDDEFHDDNAL